LSTTVNFTTVTNSVAALTITDTTILDIDEIPDAIGLDHHVLAPIPDGFVTNIEITRDELSGQLLTMKYNLNYRYYLCHVGSTGLIGNYANLIKYMALVFKAFASDLTLTGALDNGLPKIGNLGRYGDNAQNMYFCFDIILPVMQFLEV
jgi:hypothetical protein